MNKNMPLRNIILLLVLCSSTTWSSQAQQSDLYMGSEFQPIRISAGAAYQQYSDEDRSLSQVAFPVRAFIPLNRNLAFSILTNPVLITADSLASVGGLSDSQIALSYYRRIGAGSAVVSLSSNLPSGKRELTEDEFATMALLSQDFYSFRVPVIGQGFNVIPGLTVAYPLSDNVVVGAGASYQLKGAFKPVQNMTDAFAPGDELLITGGADFRLARSWALSTNISYITYQEDQLGGDSIFESGDQIFVSLQVLGNIGSNQLKLLTRYRSKAKSQLPVGDGVTTAPRTVPEQFQFFSSYRVRLLDHISATVLARFGHYNDTDFFSSKTRFDIGAAQEYTVNEVVGAMLRFVYTFGSFPGVEVGGGLVFTL